MQKKTFFFRCALIHYDDEFDEEKESDGEGEREKEKNKRFAELQHVLH